MGIVPSVCLGVSLDGVRIVPEYCSDLWLSGNKGGIQLMVNKLIGGNRRLEGKREMKLKGDEKQWSGGDFKLAEDRRLEKVCHHSLSLCVCVCERSFTVQQGLSSFQR